MIIASAIKHDGKIYLGRGHSVIMQNMMKHLGITSAVGVGHDQGFYTADGRYLDRTFSKWEAIRCEQVKLENLICNFFTSEEIWDDLDPTFRVVNEGDIVVNEGDTK